MIDVWSIKFILLLILFSWGSLMAAENHQLKKKLKTLENKEFILNVNCERVANKLAEEFIKKIIIVDKHEDKHEDK